MITLLLAIIYLAFISLGLPDSLLGSAWVIMHEKIDVPLSAMGILTMIISLCTIISSLFSDKVTRIFKTGLVTAFSTLLTAVALFGFSIATSFWQLCLIAIPYGLGAGAIDAALNNYIALHYSSRSMSFLHCFWGVGTIISPNIMSYALTYHDSYPLGYKIVAIVQTCIAFILFASLPIWNKVKFKNEKETEEIIPANLTFAQKFKIKGIFYIIFGFFAYCALESTLINWSVTYLAIGKGIAAKTAAAFGSLFCIGITIGRFLSGLITNKVGDKNMIRLGSGIILFGLILVAIPIQSEILALSGFVIMGLGCAPIYPSIIHSTPYNFGKENSQAIIGLQMASAYLGSTLMPPVFGLIATYINVHLLPLFLLIFFIIMVVMTELLNSRLHPTNAKHTS